MAVKARDDVTLANITDVANVRRYYLLQASTLAAPAAPTVNPASSPWVASEPSYSEGSTNTLYTVDLTVFSDATFDYSAVSKSSSYEAAKVAYNKAVAAANSASAAQAKADQALANSPDYITDPSFITNADGVAFLSPNASDENAGPLPETYKTFGKAVNYDNRTENLAIRTQPGRRYRLEVWAKVASNTAATATGFGLMVWFMTSDGYAANSYQGNNWPDNATTLADWKKITWEWTAPTDGSKPVFRPSIRAGNNPYLVTGFHVRDVTEAVAAQATADAAKAAAEAADGKAVAAQTAANQAQNLAGLKTSVTSTVSAPSNPLLGDIWFPLNSSGQVIGMKICTQASPAVWQDYLMVAGQILVPGTVGTTEIGPDGVLASNIKASNELWAKLAVFAKVTTDMLIAGDAKVTGSLLADVIQLATRLVAGNPDGTRVELDGTGLTVYRTSVDGDVLPAIRLGLAGESDFFGILDTSGDTLSSLDEDGNVTGQTINANQGVTLAGQDLAETLASMPQGVLAWSRLAEDMIFSTNWARVVFASIAWQPGRLYKISTTVQFDSTGNTIKVALRQSSGSSVSAGNTIRRSWSLPASRTSFPATATFEHYVNSDDLGLAEGDPVTFGIFARTTSGNARVLTKDSSIDSTAITDMVVEDVGAAVDNAVVAGFPNITGGAGSDTATTTTKRTKTYSATAAQSYIASGAKYAYNVGKVYQGTYGSNSTLHGLWVFPSVISDLSGATVNKVILRITNNHTVANAGGTARVQTHGQTGVPTTYTGGATVANVAFAKGQTKDIDLTSVAAAGLKSGAIRGFGLHSSAASDYGYWAGSAQLIITYTK